MNMFGLNLSPLALRAAGGFAAIVAVFALFAWVYHSGHSAGVKAEQKRTDPKVEAICQAAGSAWAQKGDRKKWGAGCLSAVKALDAFKTDAVHASAKAVEQHQLQQDQKTQADTVAARHDADTQRQAHQDMEKADATVRDDRVDADWLRSLGRTGGLQ